MRVSIAVGSLALALASPVAAQPTSISGTLTDAVSGLPLIGESFSVFVYDAVGTIKGTAHPANDGTYLVAVPPGTYFVRTLGPTSHVPELHSDLPCIAPQFGCPGASRQPRAPR